MTEHKATKSKKENSNMAAPQTATAPKTPTPKTIRAASSRSGRVKILAPASTSPATTVSDAAAPAVAPQVAPQHRHRGAELNGEALLKIGEAAAALGITQQQLRHWADIGFAPHSLLPGGFRRFSQADLARIREKIARPEVSSVPSVTALTIRQAAVALGVDQRTLREWADTGYAPHILLPSGYRRFTREHVARIREKMNAPEAAGEVNA